MGVPWGLSPRVRGNPFEQDDNLFARGSIPAGAGEPSALHGIARMAGVYPRGCGGTSPLALVGAAPMGLSPRVRGNPRRAGRAVDGQGSIPAGAGEPPTGSCRTPDPAVYPRGCGGTFTGLSAGTTYTGLSPRVRGNPMRRDPGHRGLGSIPAGAGEPSCVSSMVIITWVYPRGCGGTIESWVVVSSVKGLSPRVRGNPLGLPRDLTYEQG